MSEYINILCAYLVGYQIVEAIVDWAYYTPVGAAIRVVAFIIPLILVCNVAVGRI